MNLVLVVMRFIGLVKSHLLRNRMDFSWCLAPLRMMRNRHVLALLAVFGVKLLVAVADFFELRQRPLFFGAKWFQVEILQFEFSICVELRVVDIVKRVEYKGVSLMTGFWRFGGSEVWRWSFGVRTFLVFGVLGFRSVSRINKTLLFLCFGWRLIQIRHNSSTFQLQPLLRLHPCFRTLNPFQRLRRQIKIERRVFRFEQFHLHPRLLPPHSLRQRSFQLIQVLPLPRLRLLLRLRLDNRKFSWNWRIDKMIFF